MKKLGCLVFVCMWGAFIPLQAGNLSQEKLTRQVIAQSQIPYSAKTQFLMALAEFQHHAFYHQYDEDGWIEGVFDLAGAYYNALQGHSRLYAAELYSYLDTRIAIPGHRAEDTVAKYVLKALKQQTAKQTGFSKRKVYQKIEDILRPIYQKREVYLPLVNEVSRVRKTLSTMQLDAAVAQGETRWEDLSALQERQMKEVLMKTINLGKLLAQAQPQELRFVAEGLRKDPFLLEGVPMDFEKFLVRYGRYSLKQSDGILLVNVGEQMQAIKE